MRAQELLRLERKIFSYWMYWLASGDDSSGRLKSQFVEVLNQVEKALTAGGPFFMGKDVSMVDFMFAPFLEPISTSMIYFKGFPVRVADGTPTAPTCVPILSRMIRVDRKREHAVDECGK
jgi:glutathione S-transferase